MKKIRVLLGITISIVILYLIFRRIDLDKLLDALKTVNAWWIPLAILVYLIGVWVRTARWGILMYPVKRCPTRTLYPIYMISYMANNVLPLRMGDIYRAYVIGKKEQVSKSATLVTIGVERIFDGLTMLTLLALAFLFFPVSDARVKTAIQIGSYVFFGALIACYVVLMNKRWAEIIFKKLLTFAPAAYHSRLSELFDNFFVGLDALRGKRELLGVLTLSFLTWLIEAVHYWIFLWAFGFFGGFHVALSVMALVNLMIIVPAGPGYFGPFELACIIMLGKSGYGGLTHFTHEMATAYALVIHVLGQWIPSTFLGLYYMWREHLKFTEVREEETP